MKTLISFLFALVVAVAGLGVTSNSAMALTLLFGPADPTDPLGTGPNLIGVQNLDVNGTLYNVSFFNEGGFCNSVFVECTGGPAGGTGTNTFAFSTQADATAAANALLNAVFVLSNEPYDMDPELTRGCKEIAQCNIRIPYAIGSAQDPNAPIVLFMVAENNADPLNDRVFSNQTVFTNVVDGQRTWAIFSVVPIPPALLLFLSGLVAFFGVSRVGRRQAKAEA